MHTSLAASTATGRDRLASGDSIRDILHDGNKRANAIAEETLDRYSGSHARYAATRRNDIAVRGAYVLMQAIGMK